MTKPQKPRIRRERLPKELFNIMVKICDRRCGVCRKTEEELGQDLVQGHILRHTDGHSPLPHNIIPICAQCNSEHSNSDTEDTRPKDWETLFMREFLRRSGLKVGTIGGGNHLKGVVNHLAGSESTDNIQFIDLETLRFEASFEVYTTSCQSPAQPTPTTHQVKAMVNQLIDESKRLAKQPFLPSDKARERMEFWALHHPDSFLTAGRAFLHEDPPEFLLDNGDRRIDGWMPFATWFLDRYEPKGREIERAKKVREAKAQREREVTRWSDHLTVPEIPDDWPELTDADRAHLALVKSRKDGPVSSVTDAELSYSHELHERYQKFLRAEHYKKEADTRLRVRLLANDLARVTQDVHIQDAYRSRIDRASSLAELAVIENEIRARRQGLQTEEKKPRKSRRRKSRRSDSEQLLPLTSLCSHGNQGDKHAGQISGD